MEGDKIVIAGLDRAGKSSIIQRVFFNAYPEDVEKLDATRGINREHIKLNQDKNQFVFWELGGQQRYLDGYTGRPQVFSQTRLLIFVIDIQDDKRYETAINYLNQLLLLLRETTIETHVTVILHKFDPEKANELRKKQFVIFRLLKSLQSQFASVNFSQHSTSIFDDTLFYTFQNIFERLGIDIGAYRTNIQPKITLRERSQEEHSETVTKTQEVMANELINRLESIRESASVGISSTTDEFEGIHGINKLHELMKYYISQFDEVESIEVKRQAIDLLIMGYLEFISDLTIDAISTRTINEAEGQLLYLFSAQLNVVRVRFIRYAMKTQLSRIANPLKFMEEIKQLSNDLLDASYIVSNISLPQLEQLKQLINGVSNQNFSLFAQDSQDVYTFTSIQELKSAFSQDKFVPAKMIIKIELAEQFQEAYGNKLEFIMEENNLPQEQIDILTTYKERLDYLIVEFYQLVLEKNLHEYDVERMLANQFFQLTLELLTISNLGNIITDEENFQIRNIIESNR